MEQFQVLFNSLNLPSRQRQFGYINIPRLYCRFSKAMREGGGHFPLTDISDQKIVFEKQHQTLTRSTTKSLSIRRLSSCNFSSFSTAKRIFSAISLMLIPKKKIQLRNVLCWATVSCLVYTWPNIFRIH